MTGSPLMRWHSSSISLAVNVVDHVVEMVRRDGAILGPVGWWRDIFRLHNSGVKQRHSTEFQTGKLQSNLLTDGADHPPITSAWHRARR